MALVVMEKCQKIFFFWISVHLPRNKRKIYARDGGGCAAVIALYFRCDGGRRRRHHHRRQPLLCNYSATLLPSHRPASRRHYIMDMSALQL